MKPLISVILPAYNASLYIGYAIESILKQSYPHFELIIIDDGSTDDTEEIVSGYGDSRIRYIKNKTNLRLIKTLNKGIDLASGDYIARMDADDIAFPDWLENAIGGFEDAPYASVVNQLDYEMSDDGTRYWKRPFWVSLNNDALRYSQMFGNQILHPGIMVKAFVMREYRYRELPETIHREDFDLWRRLLRDHHYIKVLSSYAVLHRCTVGSITNTAHDIAPERVRMLEDDLKADQYGVDHEVCCYLVGYPHKNHIDIASKAYDYVMGYFRMAKEKKHLRDADFKELQRFGFYLILSGCVHNLRKGQLLAFVHFVFSHVGLFFRYNVLKQIFLKHNKHKV